MDFEKSSNEKRAVSLDELVTVSDLEIFKTKIVNELKLLFTKNSRTIKRWVKSNEVRKLFGVSHGTLQTMRNSGEIPYTRMGGTLYYDLDEIDNCLEKRKKRPNEKRS